MAQESEGEEAGESRVTLAQDLGKGNLASRQSRVQLQEVRRLPRFYILPLFSVGTSSDITPSHYAGPGQAANRCWCVSAAHKPSGSTCPSMQKYKIQGVDCADVLVLPQIWCA